MLPPFIDIRSVQTLIDGDRLLIELRRAGSVAARLRRLHRRRQRRDAREARLQLRRGRALRAARSTTARTTRSSTRRSRRPTATASRRSSAWARALEVREAGGHVAHCTRPARRRAGRRHRRAGRVDRHRLRAGLGDRHRQGRHPGRRAGGVRGASGPGSASCTRRELADRRADPLRRVGEGRPTPPRSWPSPTSTARWSAAPAWTPSEFAGDLRCAARPGRRRRDAVDAVG